MLSYSPITPNISIDVEITTYGPDAFPHLTRAFDLHTAAILSDCKDLPRGEDMQHRVILYCKLKGGRPKLERCNAFHRNRDETPFWNGIELPAPARVAMTKRFLQAIDESCFGALAGTTTLIAIQGDFGGLSHHDMLRYEAVED